MVHRSLSGRDGTAAMRCRRDVCSPAHPRHVRHGARLGRRRRRRGAASHRRHAREHADGAAGHQTEVSREHGHQQAGGAAQAPSPQVEGASHLLTQDQRKAVADGLGRCLLACLPMGIFNKRNAVTGWLTWIVAKRVLKQKAKAAVPGTVEGTKRPNKGAIATGIAALGGVLWFWRKKSSDDELPPPSGA